jgi:hypothetical protein
MDDDIRLCRRGMLGQGRVGPFVGIVAILHLLVLDPATGVAEHDDAADIAAQHRKILAVEHHLRLRLRRRLAHANGKVGVRQARGVGEQRPRLGAHPHAHSRAVDAETRAGRPVGDGADAGGAVTADELNPGGERGRLGRFGEHACCGRKCGDRYQPRAIARHCHPHHDHSQVLLARAITRLAARPIAAVAHRYPVRRGVSPNSPDWDLAARTPASRNHKAKEAS